MAIATRHVCVSVIDGVIELCMYEVYTVYSIFTVKCFSSHTGNDIVSLPVDMSRPFNNHNESSDKGCVCVLNVMYIYVNV